MIATLLQDLRYGLRQLARNPGFTLAAVLTLALGIGANTIIFGLVNGILLRPLPIQGADRVVALFATDRQSGNTRGVSYPEYLDYRDRSGVFEGLAAQQGAPISLGGGGRAEVVWGEIVSENYFDVLGLRPTIGRTFTARDASGPGSDPLAVLSHRLWRRRFGGSQDVIGKTLDLNGHPFTVVGVAPERFTGTRKFGFWPDVWVPMQMHAQVMPGSGGDLLNDRGSGWLQAFGRLAPGLDRGAADAGVAAFAARLERQFPEVNRDRGARLIPAGSGFDDPDSAPPQVIFLTATLAMAAVGLVLLLACANVANLLLARASSRGREMAVRRALGASRPRLVRQLLAESLLLAVAGGALGVVLAAYSDSIQRRMIPRLQFSVGFDTSIDYRVLSFALAVSLVTALVFGLAPAVHASGSDLAQGVKDRGARIRVGRRHVEFRTLLVGFQVAFSLVLLVGSGLFFKSLLKARTIEPGLARENRVLVSLNPGLQGYDREKARRLYRQVVERVGELPGVESAALSFPLPLDTYGRSRTVFPETGQSEGVDIGLSTISPGYFATVGGALARGREFGPGDSAGAPPVAIINETMARRFWGDADPVGRRFRLGSATAPLVGIVGVAMDGKYGTLGETARPYMFLPMEQDYRSGMTLVVHGRGASQALLAEVREAIERMDPNLGTFGMMTMAEHLENALNLARTSAMLAGAFGLCALALAVIGIYGVVSYSVARRTREVGIRVALGAGPGDVVRLVLREGVGPAVVGMAVGLAAALAVTGLVRGMLYDVSPRDVSVFVSIPLVLGFAAAAATYLPARRAARVDPAISLRSE